MPPVAKTSTALAHQEIVMLSSLDDVLNSFASEDSLALAAERKRLPLDDAALSLFPDESIQAVPLRAGRSERRLPAAVIGGAALAVAVVVAATVAIMISWPRMEPSPRMLVAFAETPRFNSSAHPHGVIERVGVRAPDVAFVAPVPEPARRPVVRSTTVVTGRNAVRPPAAPAMRPPVPSASALDHDIGETADVRSPSHEVEASVPAVPDEPARSDLSFATLQALPWSQPTPVAALTLPPTGGRVSGIAGGHEEGAVRAILNRYRMAYTELDAQAARAVWPSVDARALDRAFGRLHSQELVLASCKVTLAGNQATASCAGTVRFVPKIGSRSPRVEQGQWRFELGKAGEAWTIGRVDIH